MARFAIWVIGAKIIILGGLGLAPALLVATLGVACLLATYVVRRLLYVRVRQVVYADQLDWLVVDRLPSGRWAILFPSGRRFDRLTYQTMTAAQSSLLAWQS